MDPILTPLEEGGRILLVDDHRSVLDVLEKLLSARGHSTCAISNPKKALEVACAEDFDLIICDVCMPGIDGFTFHDRVRENPKNAFVPFIFLTAGSSREDVERGQSLGVDEIILKPYDPKSLLRVIEGKIKRGRSIKTVSHALFDTFRKRILQMLSHELRTPLVSINTGAELLISETSNIQSGEPIVFERLQRIAHAVKRGGERLERLVNDFVIMQQLEMGVVEQVARNRSAVFDSTVLLESYIDIALDQLEPAGFTIHTQTTQESCSVKVYDYHFFNILERLTSNAKKFCGNEKRIAFNLYARNDMVIFEVRDWGCGIDESRTHEALQAFVQLDRDKNEQQGSGLGLAIAGTLADVYGGFIEVKRAEDQGTFQRLILPLSKKT